MLQNRVPPPLVAIAFGLLMWGLSGVSPRYELTPLLAIAIALVGLTVCLAGVWSFHRARTTVNPLHPERASALVDTGIYRCTRNPMYLGFAVILLAWASLLGSPAALLGVAGFVVFMNRFQIAPEEQALTQLFAADFARYCGRVRRWL